MAVNTVEFPSAPNANTARNPSNTIWADCPFLQIATGEKDGVAYFDDFNDLPLTPTLTTQIAYGKYKAFAASSNTITNVGSVNSVVTPGGVLQLKDGAAAQSDNVTLAQAYPSYYLSGSTSSSAKLWFECRIAVSSLVANHVAFMVGLAETNLWTLTGTCPFTTGGTGLAIDASASFIGFKSQMLQTNAGQVNAVYSDRATSFTFVGASGTADATISAAFTFIKLGFVYDPYYKDSTRQIKFYADGVELTKAISNTTLTGTTNLKANALGLLVALDAGSAVANTDAVFMDWWKCAQLITVGGN